MKPILLLAATLLAVSACDRLGPSRGSNGPPAGARPAAPARPVGAAPVPGVVAVTVDGSGFTPASITFDKGSRAILRFTRTSDATCAKKVVFPALHVEKDLPLDTAVDIPIPTDSAREIGFQCGMGMFKSAVVVR